ncbi:hypothetical protein ZIOFF_047481 [Zingiber officinale]|uniref:Uncharacterized protein n=1 Tax=Zingiber officinale TaxID=94328 RepID=A0A8J5FPK2_ZINOF|nr:hypothetical protein ZIOFF_047481 [Zingiber officinale]
MLISSSPDSPRRVRVSPLWMSSSSTGTSPTLTEFWMSSKRDFYCLILARKFRSRSWTAFGKIY